MTKISAPLADPPRCGLVARLAEGEATVGELARPHAVSWQAVSALKVLEGAGLVSRDDLVRVDTNDYSVDPRAIAARVDVAADLDLVRVRHAERLVTEHLRH